MVLGRQRAARLPAEGLLARRHHGQLRRPPERRRGRARRVRRPRPHPVVQHRPVGHRGGLHRHPPDADLRRRQAHLQLADLHRPDHHADPGRHLPDRPEEQPGADDRRHQGHRGLLQRARQLGGPVHLQRRLLPLGPVVGRRPGHHQRQPRLREPAAGRRRDLLPAGHPRRPDHDRVEPEGRRLGRRLDRVVPVLAAVPGRQRHPPGGRGRPERQHVRQPVQPRRADTGAVAAHHVVARQLLPLPPLRRVASGARSNGRSDERLEFS